MTDTEKLPTVELYVRSLAPNGTMESQIETIRQLESLTEDGVIADYTVQVVGRGIVHEPCCMTTEAGKHLLERLDLLQEWTSENAAEVPGIDTVSVSTSPVHERAYAMTTVPSQLLFEYDDDGLAFVSPVTIDGKHVNVSDHLDQLRSAASEPEKEATKGGQGTDRVVLATDLDETS